MSTDIQAKHCPAATRLSHTLKKISSAIGRLETSPVCPCTKYVSMASRAETGSLKARRRGQSAEALSALHRADGSCNCGEDHPDLRHLPQVRGQVETAGLPASTRIQRTSPTRHTAIRGLECSDICVEFWNRASPLPDACTPHQQDTKQKRHLLNHTWGRIKLDDQEICVREAAGTQTKDGRLPAGVGADRLQGKPFLPGLHQLGESTVGSRRAEDSDCIGEHLPESNYVSKTPRPSKHITHPFHHTRSSFTFSRSSGWVRNARSRL